MKPYLLICLISIGLFSCQQMAFRDMSALPASFQVEDENIFICGVVYAKTPHTFKKLLQDHPEIRTVVFDKVPGSISDANNLRMGRMIRDRGLTTRLTDSSEIASGGVDLFLAGCQRIASANARVGVHAWSGGKRNAADLPRNHSEHKKYIKYYQDMGIDTSFYWFTLNAAPADSVYWMRSSEIEKFALEALSCNE